MFQFKQFSIKQDKTAMKVGTDGVLLGAWAPVSHNPFSILDVGAGTGIIALMLTQRTHAEQIDACLLYTSPSPRDLSTSRMPSSA